MIFRLKRLKILKSVRVDHYHFQKHLRNRAFVNAELMCIPTLAGFSLVLRELLHLVFGVFISVGSGRPLSKTDDVLRNFQGEHKLWYTLEQCEGQKSFRNRAKLMSKTENILARRQFCKVVLTSIGKQWTRE